MSGLHSLLMVLGFASALLSIAVWFGLRWLDAEQRYKARKARRRVRRLLREQSGPSSDTETYQVTSVHPLYRDQSSVGSGG